MTVAELAPKLTISEMNDWIAYFHWLNDPESVEAKGVDPNDGDALLKEFGIV